MMENKEFLQVAKDYANAKTVYVMGGTGQVLDDMNIGWFSRIYSYNKEHFKELEKKKGSIAMDCSGLIKTILWGNKPGDHSALRYSSTCPDINANAMRANWRKRSLSDDMVPGDIVWLPGHVGIYMGNDTVCECTPSWEGGVQIVSVRKRQWRAVLINPYINYCSDLELKIYYSIQKGDTLTKIAKKCKVDLVDILYMNPWIKDPDKIYPGDKLRIK